MKNWFKKNYKSIIITSYIIPILFAAGVSIAHVIAWYGLTNPVSWAIYLSVGVEIAALSSLAGITIRVNKAVYIPFGIVTLIQFIGNIFYSYQFIDTTSKIFGQWVELVDPIFTSFGWVDAGDLIGHKRILALLAGGFVPLISLFFLHLLVSFIDATKKEEKAPVFNNATIEDHPIGFPTKENQVKETKTDAVNDTTNDVVNEGVIEGANEGVIEGVKTETVTAEPDKTEETIEEVLDQFKNGRGFSVEIPPPTEEVKTENKEIDAKRLGSNKIQKIGEDQNTLIFKRNNGNR